MKRILRSAVLVGVTIAGITLSMVGPAGAKLPGGGTFNGTATIGCFGCGTSSGQANLKVTGTAKGKALAQKPVTATYTVTEPSATCPATGTATGSFSGAITGTFTWTRVGANAVITTTGDIKGAGVAAFAVTKPKGLPCGGPVTATVAGSVAGT